MAGFGAVITLLEVAALGAVATLGVVALARERRRVKSLLARLRRPRSRIAELREGDIVCLRGRVLGLGERCQAPLSARPCLAWELLVRERLVKRRRFVGGVDFLLEDASGTIVVRWSDADLLLVPDLEARCATAVFWEDGATVGPRVRWTCHRQSAPPLPVAEFLERVRATARDPTLDVTGRDGLAVDERCLTDGDTIVVTGEVVREAGVDHPRRSGDELYRTEAGALVLTATARARLTLSNDPSDFH